MQKDQKIELLGGLALEVVAGCVTGLHASAESPENVKGWQVPTTTTAWRLETFGKVLCPELAFVLLHLAFTGFAGDLFVADVFEERSVESSMKEVVKSSSTTGGIVCALLMGCLLGMLTVEPVETPVTDLRAHYYVFTVVCGVFYTGFGVAISSLSVIYIEPIEDAAAE